MAEQFASLGVAVPAGALQTDTTTFEVWDVNWNTVRAFLASTTQWRSAVVGTGALIRTGLDYAGAKVAIELAGLDAAECWNGLRVMEDEALSCFAEQLEARR